MEKKFFNTMLALMMGVSVMAMASCDNDEEDNKHTHTFASEWTADGIYHWKAAICEHTTEVSEKAEHSYGLDGKCIACQKEQPTVATVTQEEWIAFFASLTTISLEGEATIPEMNVRQTFKQHNGVTHQTQTRGEDMQAQYVHYDESTYTMTRYSYNNRDSVWKKYTTVYTNPEEYAAVKEKHSGLSETAFGRDFSSKQSGAGVGLGELYSAFTYDSDSAAYTASVYYVEVGYDNETNEDVYYYDEAIWAIKFENGRIVSASLTQASVTMLYTIHYNVTELVIPENVLSASENN